MFFGDGDRYNANRNGQTPCKAVTYNANLTWTFDFITQGFVNCFTKTARGQESGTLPLMASRRWGVRTSATTEGKWTGYSVLSGNVDVG
jgi:hypothetical protein